MNGLEGTNYDTSDGTNDCIAYINKLLNMSTNSAGRLILSAMSANYSNINYYLDGVAGGEQGFPFALDAYGALISNGVPTSAIDYYSFTTNHDATHITLGTNVAGYLSWGWNGGLAGAYLGLPGTYPIDGTIVFSGESSWFIIQTIESYNGRRSSFQGNFLEWYAANAFAGTSTNAYTYSNTPVGGVSNVDEPGASGNNDSTLYFGYWALGRIFAYAAWNSGETPYLQVVGDPFTKR